MIIGIQKHNKSKSIFPLVERGTSSLFLACHDAQMCARYGPNTNGMKYFVCLHIVGCFHNFSIREV